MKEGTYLCRMTDGYIKICYWTGYEWKDMWKDTLEGEVKEWMEVPKSGWKFLFQINQSKEVGQSEQLVCQCAIPNWDMQGVCFKCDLKVSDVGQSEYFHCELFDFGRCERPCEKQCNSCYWMMNKNLTKNK